MAVEAQHLLQNTEGGPQKLVATHAGWEGGGDCYDAPAQASMPGRHGCYYGGSDVALLGRQQGYQLQPSCVGLAASGPPMMMMTGQDASESGVTFGGGAQEAMMAPRRKRKRAAADEQPHQLLGTAAHLRQQLVDVDRLVLRHTARMWAELTEQRRRHARQVVAAVEFAAAKRLRAKDEEIALVWRLNWALEERVRALLVEAQVWRDLAQSNEAAANALRAELQNALDIQNQHARRGGVAGLAGAEAGGADDAASCCCGENDVAGKGAAEEEVGSATTARGRCAVCGDGAAEVLLLPCRHLCTCAACAAKKARACPACGCAKNGSVCVNFS